MGSFVQTFTFTNSSRSACQLTGWPRLELESHSSRPVPNSFPARGEEPAARPCVRNGGAEAARRSVVQRVRRRLESRRRTALPKDQRRSHRATGRPRKTHRRCPHAELRAALHRSLDRRPNRSRRLGRRVAQVTPGSSSTSPSRSRTRSQPTRATAEPQGESRRGGRSVHACRVLPTPPAFPR